MPSAFFRSFDEGTQSKLVVFRKYIKNWLPVFLCKPDTFGEIMIYDFFAGSGSDDNGVPGSPMIIVEEILNCKKWIDENNKHITVIFNEKSQSQYKKLTENLKSFGKVPFQVEIHNEDFTDLFPKIYPAMKSIRSSPKLVIIDQYGIKHVNDQVFKSLVNLDVCDILFFMASSFIPRFYKTENFKKHLGGREIDFKNYSPYQVHRAIAAYYRQLIPESVEYYVAPFSIKKGTNIYGIIFGSKHTYGMEKFLEVCWKIDPTTGEADFDIYNEKISPVNPYLFSTMNIPSKLQILDREIGDRIKSKHSINIKRFLIWGIDHGFLPKHLKESLIKVLAEQNLQINGFEKSQSIHKLTGHEMITISSKR